MITDWQPRNGWRSFLGEVGIIVLGVLVALAIGVIAESVRWRLRAAEMRQAVFSELAINAGVHDERTLVQPCLDRRLIEIEALLRQARTTGRVPGIGEIGRPPVRPTSVNSWELAAGSEALLYFDVAEVKLLSMHNSTIRENRAQVATEQEGWAALRVIEGSPGPISDNLLSELSLIVGRLRFQTYLNGIEAEQGVSLVRSLGVMPQYFALFDREGVPRSELVKLAGERSVCKALKIDRSASV